MKKMLIYILTLMLAVVLFSCSEDEEGKKVLDFSSLPEKTYTVAMILPLEGDYAERWHRLAEWAKENVDNSRAFALAEGDTVVSLNFEWYDENSEDLPTLATKLSQREDIAAVVGPYYSADVDIVARYCNRTGKPLLTMASSADVVRKWSSSDSFWNLSETDISQCEVLLSKASNYGMKKVSLLAPANSYGQTYIDWFAFQAIELGMEVGEIYQYNPVANDSFRSIAEQAMRNTDECLICAPSSQKETEVILDVKSKTQSAPWTLFSNVAYNPNTLKLTDVAEGAEGVSMCEDPETGFGLCYHTRFGEDPVAGEAQIYDALMLIAFGCYDMLKGHTTNLNDALKNVTSTEGSDMITWSYEGMTREIAAIATGRYYNIKGASGNLDFDIENGSVVTQSVYCHWVVYNGKFLILEYNTREGSRRMDSTLSAWNWTATKMQEFDENISFNYPAKQDMYALLIATSTGWKNYRHQADVLNMYQILKYLGYDDDHIILIMEDDLVDTAENPHRGEVRRHDGQNLYVDVDIDYHLSDITPDDVEKILSGQKSERLPRVITPGANDNVLVFWSGHGNYRSLLWHDNSDADSFTYDRMSHLLTSLAEKKAYRKMLWLIETCYSASVAAAAADLQIPGVLMLTAANARESSKADVYNSEYDTYMTNRFTEILTGLLLSKLNKFMQSGLHQDLTIRDLYYYLLSYTLGSHVTCVNSNNYDNLYRTGVREYLLDY